jgi:hypothetical protein
MPERPIMPAEATPDRPTELAVTRTAIAAQRTGASTDRHTELAANRTVLAAALGCAPG